MFIQYVTIRYFRPNSADVDRNGGDNEDGGVSSKAVEGNVADFLRKEATTNYDFR